MNPMKWKTRNLAYASISLFIFYFLFFYKWTYEEIYQFVIFRSDAKNVWEFVADFNNMIKLNPTIEEFNIIDDSGNYDHWKYSVQYTEHFSHLPGFRNHAHGHFIVKSRDNEYVIESKHHTCFLLGFGCLSSNSEFIFVPVFADTSCTERIKYECPLIFSTLCHREVLYQRQEIMKNLKAHFSTTRKNLSHNIKQEAIEYL